ncbi:MAG: hypothetical protein KKD77_22215 [Gammaproteobacteria bacterium]|nr:hypothetical protein [Gammaproteobacteria bacterium]
MVGHHNICIGKDAGICLTDESYMLCIKFEGFKEIRKQMTPEQYEVLNSFLSGLTAIPEKE